ncbi:hypothetical protein P3S68_023640 [Capsicum galapagoense]
MNIHATCLSLVQPSLHRRKLFKFGPKKWWEEDKGRTYGLVSRNELQRLEVGWAGIGSSRQAEAINGVQLADMSQQIAQLTRVVAQSVAQTEVMCKTIEELKKQMVSMTHRCRHRSLSPDSSSEEETESDEEFVGATP